MDIPYDGDRRADVNHVALPHQDLLRLFTYLPQKSFTQQSFLKKFRNTVVDVEHTHVEDESGVVEPKSEKAREGGDGGFEWIGWWSNLCKTQFGFLHLQPIDLLHPSDPTPNIMSNATRKEPLWASLTAGTIAGMVEGVITYPTEFVKTQAQFTATAGQKVLPLVFFVQVD